MKKILILLAFVGLITASSCVPPPKPVDQITVWHWMADRQEPLDILAAKYEALTGIKVKLELFAPSNTYTQKILSAAQANVLPDIYGILDKKPIFASFIKNGFVADLTAEFQANNGVWEQDLFVKALDVNKFGPDNIYGVKPGIYGVPLDVGSQKLLYNKALLRKAGIAKPAATFSEWLQNIAALKRVGISPFVSGFGELWLIDCFASNYAFNIMPAEKIFDTFRGKVKYTDPDWVKVLNVFKDLRDKGAFIDGVVTKGNKLAEQDFALERAAFAFNGAWSVNVYKTMNPELDYGVASLPAVNLLAPMVLWGGAESSLVVNNQSPNKDKAVAFLKWLTAREQQVFLAMQANSLPSNQRAVAQIPKNLADFAEGMEGSTNPKVWPLNEDALVSEAWLKGIQAIIIGESTPEGVARAVQKVKSRQMEKTKR